MSETAIRIPGPITADILRDRSATAVQRVVHLARFGLIALEFGLLVLVIRTFQIESKAFLRLTVLAFAGFVVHHFLPARWRMPFFVLLSVTGIGLILGPVNGLWLVAFGLILIGLAHIPVSFGKRVGLILVFCGLLASWRAGWISAPCSPVIWPILGAMFMFRLALYLYDLRHQAAPFGFWRATAYFFMLPNVCFPLFPAVDYKSFCRTYFNDDSLRIYQSGVTWIFRGVVHLLLYRFVYQTLLNDPTSIVDAQGAARYILATYLLYLKVSGTFHLIVGMLHLFGFNLSETHHLYLLSSSFTDFWRRINIYWKEFLQKLIFNPLFLGMSRRMNRAWALTLTTLIAFLATWVLHSYQWFWIRGDFPITWQDGVFWLFLGALVLVNMLIEARRPPIRKLKSARPTAVSEWRRALCTIGTFLVICTSWTVWTSPSVEDLRALMIGLVNMTPGAAAWILGGLIVLGLAAVRWGRSTRANTEGGRSTSDGGNEPPFWVPALRTIALCGVLILVGRDPLLLQAYPALAETVDNLREPQRLNARDTRLHERGYYEDLTDATRFNTELAGLYAHRPADWNVDGGVYQTGGFPPYAMLPSHQVIYKGVVQATNRWGMRDRDYEQSKPSGVFRVALLGSSHSKGSGVSADVNYENVAEDALNSENADGSRRRIEILNFSVGGYGPLCRLALLEEKVLSFQPDLVVFEGIDDFTWIVNEMANAVDKGIAIPFGPIVELMERAGAGPGLARIVAEQKLRPHAGEALEWTCRRFVETCRRNGAKPVAIFLPRPEIIRGESQLLSDQSELARRTGFEVIDMSQAYGAVADKRKLWIAPWDQHPNATGHRLLAERFLAGLRRELPVRNESTQTEKDSTHETDDGA